LRNRQKQLALEAKAPMIDAGDARRRGADGQAEMALEQMLAEGRGMGGAAARASDGETRRPFAQPRDETRERLGKRALLPRDGERRLARIGARPPATFLSHNGARRARSKSALQEKRLGSACESRRRAKTLR
jgi:hypothetical protein